MNSMVVHRLEEFIRHNPKFEETCEELFDSLEVNGRVSLSRAVRTVDVLFDHLAAHLDSLQVPVERLSREDVLELFRESDHNPDNWLDEQEFKDFYAKVLLCAAKKAAGGFMKSYGIGILTATVGLMAVKRTLRAVPLFGLVASPIVGLFPTLLVGPALGVGLTYAIRKEGLQKLKERLFGRADRGSPPKTPAVRG